MSDTLAKKVFFNLVSDFRSLLGDDNFGKGCVSALSKSVADYREYEFPLLGEVDPMRFKAYKQLQNLFKKYSFFEERENSDALDSITIEKFLDFQRKRASYHDFKASTLTVLKEARSVIKAILGDPVKLDFYRRIGKRAEVKCPLHKAYFDNKLGDARHFTCPSTLLNDLLQSISEDHHLRDILLKTHAKSEVRVVDHLKLVLVDKSWKIRRPITPLSTWALYVSYGIGGHTEACLRDAGNNISRRQQLHRKLVRAYSIDRSHVTADLVSASDSLRSDILNRVLPRWFYRALRTTFCRTLLYDGTTFASESVLPMGNGATFPVETLVFWGLILAVRNLTGIGGFYSAYGDDLIYPRKAHRYIKAVFDDLGIEMNVEKTSVYSHFRESCGGDFYHGFDVRPVFFPKDVLTGTRRLYDLQIIYKFVNSLLRRWDASVIPKTLNLLRMEILMLKGEIFYVPPTFPDTAGWKIDRVPEEWSWSPAKVVKRFSDGMASYHFKYLGESPTTHRLIIREDIYYWCSFDNVPPKDRLWRDRPTKWGRYTCVGVNPIVAKLFLKDLAIKEGQYMAKKVRKDDIDSSLFEPSNGSLPGYDGPTGKPRISYATVGHWA